MATSWDITSLFDYEDLGMNNSCIHDFIVSVYHLKSLDPVGFDPDKADIFRLICNGGSRSIKKPSAKKMKEFTSACKAKTPFIFSMQAIGLDCYIPKPRKSETISQHKQKSADLAGRKTVLVWYVNPLLKEMECVNVDLPLVSNWVFRMLGHVEDLADSFKANMAGVTTAFIEKYNFESISKAFVVFMCSWLAFRVADTFATYDAISLKVLKASKQTLLDNLAKFNVFVDRWVRDKGCKPPTIYHIEQNKCVGIESLQPHRIAKAKTDIRYGASAVKGKGLRSDFAIGEGVLTFALNTADTLAALLLENPTAVSTPINLEDHTVLKASWEQQFWTLPKADQTQESYSKRILVWPKQIIDTISFGLLHPGVRFVIIPLIIKDTVEFGTADPVPDAHSNLLIYDKQSKTWERWEPHGANVYDMFDAEDYPGMEKALVEELDLTAKALKGIDKIEWKYIAPDQSCPWVVVGKDYFQRDERGYLLRDDDEGLCETWSFWYLYTKLKNPGIAQSELLSQARDAFKGMLGTKIFIRRFKTYLDSITSAVSTMGTYTFYEELKAKQNALAKQIKPKESKQQLSQTLQTAPFTFQYELGQNNTIFWDWVTTLMGSAYTIAPSPLVFTITETTSSVDFSPFEQMYDDLEIFLVRCIVRLPHLNRTIQFVGLADCESDDETFEIFWPDLPLLTELKILNKIEYELSDRFDPIYAITLPYEFIDKFDFPSASIAYLPWLLSYVQARKIFGIAYSSSEIVSHLLANNTVDGMTALVTSYLDALSNYYKQKCKSPKILHPELDTCVSPSSLQSSKLIASPVKIKYGASVVKGKKTKLTDESDFYIPVEKVMAYLMLHFPFVGSSIPNIVTGVYKSVTWKPISPDSSEFILKWGNDITTLISKVMADPTKRFILIDSTLVETHTQEQADNDEVEAHSNIFLFDKLTNEFEIWEPWGNFKSGLETYHTDKFYDAVRAKVDELKQSGILPADTKVVLSIDVCPVQLPSFQTGERADLLESDDEGLCLTWSYWYLETRLKNPSVDRVTVIKEALKAFQQMVGTKAFIRRYRETLLGYAAFFNRMTQEEFVELLQTIYATLPPWKQNPLCSLPWSTPSVDKEHEAISVSPNYKRVSSVKKADCKEPTYKWITGKGCFQSMSPKVESVVEKVEEKVLQPSQSRLTRMVKLKKADCVEPQYKWVTGKGCFEVGIAKPYSPVETKVSKTKTECVPDPPYRWVSANKAAGIARGYCLKSSTGFTPKKPDCRQWLAKPTVDPITLAQIVPGSERYQELVDLCGVPNLIFDEVSFVLGTAANDGNCFFDSLAQLIVAVYNERSAVELRQELADQFTVMDFVKVNGGMTALELIADMLPSPESVQNGQDILDQIESLDDEEKESVMDTLVPEWEEQKEQLEKNGVWAEDWMIGFASKTLRYNIFIYNDAANQFYLTAPFQQDWNNVFIYNFDQAHFVPLRTTKKKKVLKSTEIPNIIAAI